MVVIRFDVPFVTGLPRPRAMSLPGRRGVRFYADPAGETAKTAVAAAYHRAAAAHRDEITPEMFGGPVSVTVTTFRRLPKSTPKRITAAPDTVRPDLDNVVKLILDALNGRAFRDDCQVVELAGRKRDRMHGVVDRTEITVTYYGGQ